jgi:hypothetical protein
MAEQPRSQGLAEPKRRSRVGWRPGLDSNQDKEQCIAPASKAFRHRAVAIIADHAAVNHH